MAWFQMKYGIAIIYLGVLALALDHNRAEQWLAPTCIGTLIVLSAYLAQRLKRFHYFLLQCNTMMFIGLAFLAGKDLAHSLTPASILFGVGLVVLCSLALFITNASFQEEPENLDELAKPNDSSNR